MGAKLALGRIKTASIINKQNLNNIINYKKLRYYKQ
jgi:hypothetical protein